MAPTRIPCPECGAGLKSSSGFVQGETVCCPKCETYFTVEAPEEEAAGDAPSARKKPISAAAAESGRKKAAAPSDEGDEDFEEARPKKKKKRRASDDESESSYKNSPLRFAVLGILIIVLVVLGFLLYQKKQREAKENAANEAENSSRETSEKVVTARIRGDAPKLTPKTPAGGAVPPRVEQPATPESTDPAAKELKARLIGKWKYEDANPQKAFTVEYKRTGEFEIAGQNLKGPLVGTWRVVSAVQASDNEKPKGIVLEMSPGKNQLTHNVDVIFDSTDSLKQSFPFLGPNIQSGPLSLLLVRVKE